MADVNDENQMVEQEEQVQGQEENQTPTVEELLAIVAKNKAENEKLKNQLSKSNSEAAAYKKALREKQTAEEQEAEAKKEAEEQQKNYISELEKFKKTAEAKARYALQGMNSDLATKAAEAEIAGDMDTLATIQKQHTDLLIKEREAEWIKSRPAVNAGAGTDETTVTKEQFNKMSYKQKVKFKQKYPETYQKYTEQWR